MGRARLALITLAILALISLGFLTAFLVGREARVRVATTTSLYATGLLEFLADEFSEKQPGVSLDFMPVGSGEALRKAELGDACLVFVHAPSLEKKYISKGVISGRRIFAYNYFIIAGPASDPAGIRDSESPIEAFIKIYEAGERGEAVFASRGDGSGTHVRELSLWDRAGLDPRGRPWYMETGSGMGHTLLVANEKKAYVLSDLGTYLKFKKEGKISNLELLYQGGSELINVYSVYLVSSCTGRERDLAVSFMDFVSKDAQSLIAEYGIDKFGQPLFKPAEGSLERLEEFWEMLAS